MRVQAEKYHSCHGCKMWGQLAQLKKACGLLKTNDTAGDACVGASNVRKIVKINLILDSDRVDECCVACVAAFGLNGFSLALAGIIRHDWWGFCAASVEILFPNS